MEVQGSGNGSKCHQRSSQSSERAPEAPEGHQVCDVGEGEGPLIGWSEVTCAFTSGVSKMRLTCVRSVMCQVYLVKEPTGSPSFLTNTGLSKKRPRNLLSASESLGLSVCANWCVYLS